MHLKETFRERPGVNATTLEDVQAAVQFAVQHDLKLVVKKLSMCA